MGNSRAAAAAGRSAGGLRIGEGSANATYGVKEHVKGDGRFSTTYTFGAGEPSFHKTYWFQVASLPMGGDNPLAPADSRKITVAVGGHSRGMLPLRQV